MHEPLHIPWLVVTLLCLAGKHGHAWLVTPARAKRIANSCTLLAS
jgi:hypothetical protein